MRLRVFAPADATLAALLLVVLTLVVVPGLITDEGPGFAVLSRPQAREYPVQEVSRSANDLRVNPNRVGPARLAALPGIGPALAETIVQFRETHGPFRELSDLQGVPGIGPNRLQKLLPYLTLREEATWSTR